MFDSDERLPVGTSFEHAFRSYEVLEIRPRHYLVKITAREESTQVFAHHFMEEWHADSLARGIRRPAGAEASRLQYLPKERERDPNEN